MTRSLQETLFRISAVRWAVAAVLLGRGLWLLGSGRLYRAMNDFARVVRTSGAGPLTRFARRRIFRVIEEARRTGRNPLVDAYRHDPASAALASRYSVSGSGSSDIFRDLIVLKRATPNEKGVILLKYGRTFDALVAIFDVDRLMQHYTFVLEPCWAGYCDPSILMLVAPGHPVFVQCFTDEDYQFIAEVGAPLVPLRLGPADWVDADVFSPPENATKPYDLVMVANWGAHKRHAQLFAALRQITDRDVRVLLIGFPWANRTADDIRREARAITGDRIRIDILESIPAAQVAAHVSRCKVFVFLSRKEGDNKAVVEAMFADVPAIVYDRTVGGAASRINAATGVLASDEELAAKIRYMLDHYGEFTPRRWALEHTGSALATKVLDAAIRSAVTSAGGRYSEPIVQKTNSPNLAYKEPGVRTMFHADYEFVLSCRRQPAPPREAVA